MCVGARASLGASVELALLFTGGGRPPGVLGARLIRAFLAKRLGGPEEVWTVGHDAAGAPFALREGRSRPVHVSVSYAEGLVAAALSTASPLGIDVERLSPHGADGALADSFFSEPERAFLASLAQEERRAAFFRI
ncbi:4'-phosphopantetheinyl transferase family protein [Gellertiella hungarica]|uniref:Phosphopantetheinyl transferase n=1 Tax=Gellertiella hungarica TaxID=1572859 RepID=A0A7W6JA41_9HYPH|nr:4'-phosphopantetheinyl transferase superfamily protein [Gellertiella hungarica]MBB4066666.1 phosphopantetheinyl transferase [Gellertiella hungarica]